MEISGLCATSADLQRACSHGHACLQQATGSNAVSVDVSCVRTLLLATAFLLREWQAIASSLGSASDGGSQLEGTDELVVARPSFRPDLAQIELMEQASARITELSTELEGMRTAHAATIQVFRSELDAERLPRTSSRVGFALAKRDDTRWHEPHSLCNACEKVLDSVLRTEAAEVVSASLLLHARMREEEATHARERETWCTDAMRVEYAAMVAEVQKSEEEQRQLLRVVHECKQARSKCQEFTVGRLDAFGQPAAHPEVEHFCVLRRIHLRSEHELQEAKARLGYDTVAPVASQPADGDGCAVGDAVGDTVHDAELSRATPTRMDVAEDTIASADDMSIEHKLTGLSQVKAIWSAQARVAPSAVASRAEVPMLKEQAICSHLREECVESVGEASTCDSSLAELRAGLCDRRSAHHTVSADSCDYASNFVALGQWASSAKTSENAVAGEVLLKDANVAESPGDARSECLEERIVQLSSELEDVARAATESEAMRQECRSQAADVALLRVRLEATSRAGAQLKLALDEARRRRAAPLERDAARCCQPEAGLGLGLGLGAPKTGAEAEIIRRSARRRGVLLREELVASTPLALEDELAVERRRVRSLEESHEALRASVAEASRRDAAAQRWAAEEASELERLRLCSSSTATTGSPPGPRAEPGAPPGDAADAAPARRAAVSALRAAAPQARAARMEVEELRTHLEEAASARASSPPLSTKRPRSTR